VVGRSEAKGEPSARRRLGRNRLPGKGDGVLGLQRDDSGAEFDPLGARAHQRDRGERVEVGRDLRHPHGVEARLLGPCHVVDHPRDLADRVPAFGPDHHSDTHAASRFSDRRRVMAR
jgi:hypothetical protein